MPWTCLCVHYSELYNILQDCPRPGHGRCAVDKHWKPFVSRSGRGLFVLFFLKQQYCKGSLWQHVCRCAFCTTHYTVIAKAETFKEDLRLAGDTSNLGTKNLEIFILET